MDKDYIAVVITLPDGQVLEHFHVVPDSIPEDGLTPHRLAAQVRHTIEIQGFNVVEPDD